MRRVIPLFMPALVLAGCASGPSLQTAGLPREAAPFGALPRGGALYLQADAAAALPLLLMLPLPGLADALSGDPSVKKLLDRTESAAAVFFDPPEAPPPAAADAPAPPPPYLAAALGAYPRSLLNTAFALSPSWKKQPSPAGGAYWRSGALSAAAGASLFLLSSGDPLAYFAQAGAASAAALVPEGFAAFQKGAALAGWIETPDQRANAFLSDLGIPITLPAQALVFAVFATAPPGHWEAALRITMAQEAQARAIAGMLSLAGPLLARADPASPLGAAAPLFAGVSTVEGKVILVRSAPFDAPALARLFGLFAKQAPRD
ncbi:MAG: hypothetical protein LBR16_02325 [Treponema sp.]|jgi:hypothetical protein|nr:hypothetical protein [Treponema sp.]